MMKWLLAGFILLLGGCAQQGNPKEVNVKMYNPDGDSLGTIKVQEQSKGVAFDIKLSGIESGEHAIHIHEKGKCAAPDFKSAGDHYNPDDKKHGLLHPEGAHAGDLPNLIVSDDGSTKAKLTAPQVTLKEGKTSLFTMAGTSLVIHERKDDGMTQPAGDSGQRIACGEISGKNKTKR
ncbi:superoxide dismutase family protein [Peribacillus cavernae]|uniref:Superoxide dismutase [Cu-Zn] n=1 Tax=Peribacillus cavernae TaxID=1674310 RepID=A0A3S0TXI6_9BACI|nr:superoxide dismutase family protein [Peribacillus cavernae]MDQ0219620.1 Cu-Zn family superoxide dismutase [Peribacillus cavernae]RUQ25907.1 superoxide dismutase family protein [Peribacillus cavernae]